MAPLKAPTTAEGDSVASEKPGLYQSQMVLFLLDEFDVLVTVSSIGRALRSRGWTKKQIRRNTMGGMRICVTTIYTKVRVSYLSTLPL
jgi:hypothetical protein